MRNDKTTYGAHTVTLHCDIRENLYTGQIKRIKKTRSVIINSMNIENRWAPSTGHQSSSAGWTDPIRCM